MQGPIGHAAGAWADFFNDGIGSEVEVVAAAAADRFGLEPRQGAALFQILTKRIEVRVRQVRLAEQLVDLFRKQDPTGTGPVEESNDGIGGHRARSGATCSGRLDWAESVL